MKRRLQPVRACRAVALDSSSLTESTSTESGSLNTRRRCFAVSRGTCEKGRTVINRPTVNITAPERAGRVILGLVTAAAAMVLLGAASTTPLVLLEVLLLLAGVDLVVTGALGHCPLYSKLGHVPQSLRRS